MLEHHPETKARHGRGAASSEKEEATMDVLDAASQSSAEASVGNGVFWLWAGSFGVQVTLVLFDPLKEA